MKGLLVKDFQLLKNQKQFLLVIALVTIGFEFLYKDPATVIGYMTAMVSLAAISTIGYDEQNGGMSYLFTLPVSRSGYVKEKYVFGFLAVIASLAVITFFSVLIFMIRHVSIDRREWITAIAGSCFASILLQAFFVPIQLKFGAERNRTASAMIVGGVFVLAFILVKIADILKPDMTAVIAWFQHAGAAEFVGILGLLTILAAGISFGISLHVMKRKEF